MGTKVVQISYFMFQNAFGERCLLRRVLSWATLDARRAGHATDEVRVRDLRPALVMKYKCKYKYKLNL